MLTYAQAHLCFFSLHGANLYFILQLCLEALITISGRECIIWCDQYLNKASMLNLQVMIACNFVLQQPLTTSNQFHLPNFTHKASVNQCYGFQAFAKCTAHWEHLCRLYLSRSHLDKYILVWFEFGSHSSNVNVLTTRPHIYTITNNICIKMYGKGKKKLKIDKCKNKLQEIKMFFNQFLLVWLNKKKTLYHLKTDKYKILQQVVVSQLENTSLITNICQVNSFTQGDSS